jgi:ubiquinone/menaquinone biosynthesis C-methylase UbiE
MDARQQLLIQRRGWDRASTCYERFWQRQLQPAQDRLLESLALAPGEAVVDVACGSGALTLSIASAVGQDGRVLATDLSPKMTAATEARASAAGARNVATACRDAEALDFDAAFDVAVCSLGLMYVPDPPAAIVGMHRALRPGGRIGLLVWGERSRCGWASVFGIVDARVSSDVCPRFFALGAPGALSTLLERDGFVDITETRVCVTLDYADDSEALGAAFLGGPVALAYARFDDGMRREASDEYLRSIAAFRNDDGSYHVPGEFVVATASTHHQNRRSKT